MTPHGDQPDGLGTLSPALGHEADGLTAEFHPQIGVTHGPGGVDDAGDIGDRYPLGLRVERHRRISGPAVLTDPGRSIGAVHAADRSDQGQCRDPVQHRGDLPPDSGVPDRPVAAQVHHDLVAVTGLSGLGRPEPRLRLGRLQSRQAERVGIAGAEHRVRNGERDQQGGPDPDDEEAVPEAPSGQCGHG